MGGTSLTTPPHAHWDLIYHANPDETVSWYQAQPGLSLELIAGLNLSPGAPIIDVGAGASTLADALLNRGCGSLTLLDLSQEALPVTSDTDCRPFP